MSLINFSYNLLNSHSAFKIFYSISALLSYDPESKTSLNEDLKMLFNKFLVDDLYQKFDSTKRHKIKRIKIEINGSPGKDLVVHPHLNALLPRDIEGTLIIRSVPALKSFIYIMLKHDLKFTSNLTVNCKVEENSDEYKLLKMFKELNENAKGREYNESYANIKSNSISHSLPWFSWIPSKVRYIYDATAVWCTKFSNNFSNIGKALFRIPIGLFGTALLIILTVISLPVDLILAFIGSTAYVSSAYLEKGALNQQYTELKKGICELIGIPSVGVLKTFHQWLEQAPNATNTNILSENKEVTSTNNVNILPREVREIILSYNLGEEPVKALANKSNNIDKAERINKVKQIINNMAI